MKSTPWPRLPAPSGDGRRRALSVAVLLLITLLVVFASAFARDLNHDEEQFIAPPALLGQGLLPYGDYPFFHTPNLVFIFAALFKTTTHYLLAARAFNASCAALLLLLIFGF